jgi:adenylate cyclase
MAEEGFKRKLTAILSADVEGYSRLMGDDEEATVRTLKSYREVLSTLIQQHNGQVLDSPGDNLLAEFASVVDAVQCAVAVQKEIKARNDELPEDRRMHFRIGINLGDVIQEEGRIYGDGVNIAARLESLAEPGGICISKTAFDHIESKLPYGYDFIGEQTVKNIAKPVGAYRVQLDPRVTVSGKPAKSAKSKRVPIFTGTVVVLVLAIAVGIWQFYTHRSTFEPASLDKMAYSLPDKPSIAVLPFDNLSGDPEQDHLSDGITEQIIANISKTPHLFVIARNSTFTYKGKPVKVQQVAEELGVQYVLEGSVQKSGEQIRITAQLIDAIKGHHLWSKRYDRDLNDIFALQDEITMKIMMALQVELTEGEQARFYSKGTENLEAYFKFLKGNELFRLQTPDSNKLARQMAEKAIELDPEYAAAYRLLAWITMYDESMSHKKRLDRAYELAQKALELDDSLADAYALLGGIHARKRDYEKAIALRERAVALSPNGADVIVHLGGILNIVGRPEEGLRLIKKGMRLNPFSPIWYSWALAGSYQNMEQYEKVIEVCEPLIKQNPDNYLLHLSLAVAYSLSDREEEARNEATEILRLNPKFSVEVYEKTHFAKDPAVRKRGADALRKAGLK